MNVDRPHDIKTSEEVRKLLQPTPEAEEALEENGILETKASVPMFVPLSPNEHERLKDADEEERHAFIASIPSFERLARCLAADGQIGLALRARKGEFVLEMGALLKELNAEWTWRVKQGEFRPSREEREAAYARFAEE